MPRQVTAVEEALSTRRRWTRPLVLLGLLCFLLGAAALIAALLAWAVASRERTPHHADAVEHFLYGSIGSEPESGLPADLWRLLPHLMPEAFDNRGDWSAFGFLYEDGRDLPIGVSTRRVSGVELAWLNCAVCHTGTWRADEGADPVIVAGMPSNNLDFGGFIRVLLDAAVDERLSPDAVFAAMRRAGDRPGPIKRLIWRHAVLPQVREGLLATRARLLPLLDYQPAWGPGRVDTFNPYKLLHGGWTLDAMDPAERVGASDFPSIFLQRPRDGMDLHWDGNNASLAERNLSAALGAGVTPDTVDHAAIRRVADWLLDLPPPPSPHSPEPEAIEAGREIYMENCAACHGYQGPGGYVFEGEYLGKVEPLDSIGTDPARLDSYTAAFNAFQRQYLFAGTRHAFRHFQLTDGYANMPLDGLWLRGPYLHNGSVPTLADLLEPVEARPAAFLRHSDVVDGASGGFISPACDPGTTTEGFCFDTTLPGNGNGGHLYGTDLPEAQRAALLAYLLTF